MFHRIKNVDWVSRGATIVVWKIIPIEPLDCDVKQFIKEKEMLGWEVIAFTSTVDNMPAIYVEMDKRLHDKIYGEEKCITTTTFQKEQVQNILLTTK